MSRQLSDVLEMFSARGPQLRDVGQFAQRSAVFNAPKRPTTLDAIDAKSAMTHYRDDPRPSFPDVTGQKPGDLPGYLRLVKGLLVGEPEKLLSGEQSQIGGTSGPSFSYPTGLPDALAALPMFGGVMRAAKNTAKPFFSSLARTLSERAPAIGTAEHFLNVARKGGKAEELAWTGLEDWLRSQPGKIKRDDVLRYVDDNLPELRERMIGDTKSYPVPPEYELRPTISREGGHMAEEYPMALVHVPTGEQVMFSSSLNPNINTLYHDYSITRGMRPVSTKFATDNLTLPGGENHRELVVTMPPKIGTTPRKTEVPLSFEDWNRQQATGGTRDELIDAYQDYLNGDTADEFRKNAGIGNYNVPAGHAYGDPELDVNRLFHARMNDRTTATGERALHLEELQSDWHQTGRKEGYNIKLSDDLPVGMVVEYDDALRSWVLKNDEGEVISDIHRDQAATRQEAIDFFSEEGGDDAPMNMRGVPDAPFKNTWHELGMRRMLQEAVDGDYARLTWTTGAQQADRYSLASHVDKLRYDPATQELTGFKGRGIGPIITQKVAPADLPDYIGQETADKLLATPHKPRLTELPKGYGVVKSPVNDYEIIGPNGGIIADGRTQQGAIEVALDLLNNRRMNYHELTGQDLKLGGEGMKGFYDKMLPSYMNKVGKKYGVKAEMTKIPDTNWVIKPAGNDKYWVVGPNNRKIGPATREQAIQILDKEGGQPVWSLKITPEMRQDLLEKGQPLFQVSPPVPLPRYERKKTTRDLSMWPAH